VITVPELNVTDRQTDRRNGSYSSNNLFSDVCDWF